MPKSRSCTCRPAKPFPGDHYKICPEYSAPVSSCTCRPSAWGKHDYQCPKSPR